MSVHLEAYKLCERIAQALNTAAPGVRAKITVMLDGTRVHPHDVVVEIRPPQPKAGMTGA